MTWYATDTLEETYGETKEFLFPFDVWLWLKISVILLFVGGSYSGVPTTGYGDSLEAVELWLEQDAATEELLDDVGGEEVAQALEDVALQGWALAFAAALLIVFVVWTYLAAVFEIVFYRSMHDDEVRLKWGFKRYVKEGFAYFVFNWLMLAASLGGFALLIYAFFRPGLGLGTAASLAALTWVVVWLLSFVVRNLALPEVAVADTGFLQGFRVSLGYVRREWKQALVFLLVKVVVGVVASVLVTVAVTLASVVLLIPLILAGLVLYFVSPWLVAVPVLVFVLGILVIWFLVAVPVQTYIYRWVLNVYGGFSATEETQ